jgi:thiamine-phosphate pyrophosphorylase
MYREPQLSDKEFYGEAVQVKEMCEEVGAGLILNDRLDIAALIRAEGVHLGSNDLPVRVVKEYMGDDFYVGYSAHSEKEALTIAWEGADYITFSPIFDLEHKDSKWPPHGIEGSKQVYNKIKIPIFLLGGIRLPDLATLREAIPNVKVAGVSMIAAASNVMDAIEEVLTALDAPMATQEDS